MLKINLLKVNLLKVNRAKVDLIETLNKSLYLEPYRPMETRYLESTGRVVEALTFDTVGRIKLDGVLWKARLPKAAGIATLPVGTRVHILYREELTLVVQSISTGISTPA